MSRAGVSRAELCRAEPNRAEPSRAVPCRAVPQSPARRRGGDAGEFRHGRSGRRGPLLPGTVMLSEEPGWPLKLSHLPELSGGGGATPEIVSLCK